MDSVVEVAEDRAPLLSSAADGEIQQSPPDKLPEQSQRLVSLDVFRGLTVAVRSQSIAKFPTIFTGFSFLIPFVLQLMILVDDAGGKFPSINHAPWFGVTLADFVMPFFLFGVGISIALVFKVNFLT